MKKHIPNTITSLNLLCGSAGVIAVFYGRPDLALWLMLSAAVFDFCDGLAARLLHAYSDIGKELDSLADDISFGLLPSVLLFNTMARLRGLDFWSFIPLLIAAFSALRLARFNLDSRQTDGFIGLPTPACAIICASLCHYIYSNPSSWISSVCSNQWTIPLMSLVLCWLLVCELPMFAFKFGPGHKADKNTMVFRIAFVCIAVISVILCLSFNQTLSLALLLTFTGYILLNVIKHFITQ